MKSTKIYGQSDDNVITEGEYYSQYSNYSQAKKGFLIIVNDGTILKIKYGKEGLAVWSIIVLNKGKLFDTLVTCEDEDADIYSDIVFFSEGVKFMYACADYEKMD